MTLADYLSEIANSDIPYRADPEVKAARKKEKQQARSRKHQSKRWSMGKQDQIRAEGAANKAARERNALY